MRCYVLKYKIKRIGHHARERDMVPHNSLQYKLVYINYADKTRVYLKRSRSRSRFEEITEQTIGETTKLEIQTNLYFANTVLSGHPLAANRKSPKMYQFPSINNTSLKRTPCIKRTSEHSPRVSGFYTCLTVLLVIDVLH